MDIDLKLKVLSKIAKNLNGQKIVWAVGASTLLYLKGVVNNFNDIDLMIEQKDRDTVKSILSKIGRARNTEKNKQYNSKAFFEFVVDGVDIDVIAGFVIKHQEKEYYFPLEKDKINETVVVENETIYLHDVDEWKKYYRLMNRQDKVKVIEECMN